MQGPGIQAKGFEKGMRRVPRSAPGRCSNRAGNERVGQIGFGPRQIRAFPSQTANRSSRGTTKRTESGGFGRECHRGERFPAAFSSRWLPPLRRRGSPPPGSIPGFRLNRHLCRPSTPSSFQLKVSHIHIAGGHGLHGRGGACFSGRPAIFARSACSRSVETGCVEISAGGEPDFRARIPKKSGIPRGSIPAR